MNPSTNPTGVSPTENAQSNPSIISSTESKITNIPLSSTVISLSSTKSTETESRIALNNGSGNDDYSDIMTVIIVGFLLFGIIIIIIIYFRNKIKNLQERGKNTKLGLEMNDVNTSLADKDNNTVNNDNIVKTTNQTANWASLDTE